MFPLRPGRIVFDAGTLLTIGGQLRISKMGIVVDSKKRSSRVFILENPSGATGVIREIGALYLWVDPLGRYQPTPAQLMAYDQALTDDKNAKAEAKKTARTQRMLKTSSVK